MDPAGVFVFDLWVSPDELSPLSARGKLFELELALARQLRIARGLTAVGSALGSIQDLDNLLELILAKVAEVLEADRATLYLLDEGKKELVSRVVVGGTVRSIRLKVGVGIAGLVAQSGKAIRVKNAATDKRFEPEWDRLTGYVTTSILAVPLKNHLGRTIGVIQVLNKKLNAEFSDEDEETLSALSTQAAVAIDNSRLFLSQIQKNKQLLDTKEELERRVRDLELLFQLERATAAADSIERLVEAFLAKSAEACGALGGAVLLVEEESGDLTEYVFNAKIAELLPLHLKSREGFLGASLTKNQELFATDPQHKSFSPRVEGRFGFPVTSALAIPLDPDSGLGAIGLFSKATGQGFTAEDLSLMRLIAANAATAVRLFNAQVARERTQRLTTIGRLLSQVVHDFKTPMTVISGYVQMMQEADDPALRRQYGQEILQQFEALTAMQREVLEFARGEQSIFIRKVYLGAFFQSLERQLQLSIEGRPMELSVKVDKKLVAYFDEGRISRAIFNLTRNAIEAMAEKGGKLSLEAVAAGEALTILVSDTGPGIPEEIRGRLFQSFVTAGKQGGTGLGLAIVRKIAEEHEGTVRVHSSEKGATFELCLPHALRVVAPSKPRQAPLGSKGKRKDRADA
ncbi:MAG: GAF domain-containing sensor histidine kinase [Polyangiaceae bacterium]|nr:GAF domain-containing sensor histidine kinase [Polyangiaceae bacterium]